MKVAVNGFGSIWTHRFGKQLDERTRFTAGAAFYNTTGIPIRGCVRPRSRVYGFARFNGASGFSPHEPERMVNRVFYCAEPVVWKNGNRILFASLISESVRPDYYLVTVHEHATGWIDRNSNWRSAECHLLSFSESDEHQEAMLLMSPFGWLRGGAGVFVLLPERASGSRSPCSSVKVSSPCDIGRERSI